MFKVITEWYNNMITDIINQKENVLVVVSLNDLKELVRHIYDEREAEIKALSDKQHDKELLSADETSSILGVKKNSLWRWSKNGYLTPVKIGRKCYYRMDDINRIQGNK